MSPGSIAHYKITSKLGEGGMGAVYRARDTKLGRDVALKVLPDSFANDPDRLARFTREAQTLASLNHPNIAQIYGIEQNALVMELVEGEDLSTLIMRGQPETERVARESRDSEVSARRGGGPPTRRRRFGELGRSLGEGQAPRKPNKIGLGLRFDEALPIAR